MEYCSVGQQHDATRRSSYRIVIQIRSAHRAGVPRLELTQQALSAKQTGRCHSLKDQPRALGSGVFLTVRRASPRAHHKPPCSSSTCMTHLVVQQKHLLRCPCWRRLQTGAQNCDSAWTVRLHNLTRRGNLCDAATILHAHLLIKTVDCASASGGHNEASVWGGEAAVKCKRHGTPPCQLDSPWG